VPGALYQATADSEAELARVGATLRDIRSKIYQALDRVSRGQRWVDALWHCVTVDGQWVVQLTWRCLPALPVLPTASKPHPLPPGH
jgi:hypothetical protein